MVLLIIGIVGLSAILISNVFLGPNIAEGNHTIIVLCCDPTEQRDGLGGVDMAFAISLNEGNITNVTKIYGGGLYHKTQAPPAGVGTSKWMLHDTLWTSDQEYGLTAARDIIQSYHPDIHADGVVAVSVTSIDEIIKVIGPISSGGYTFTGENGQTLSLLRETQHGGSSRGDAIEQLGFAMLKEITNKDKLPQVIQVALSEYEKGNIWIYPSNLLNSLLAAKGFNMVTS